MGVFLSLHGGLEHKFYTNFERNLIIIRSIRSHREKGEAKICDNFSLSRKLTTGIPHALNKYFRFRSNVVIGTEFSKNNSKNLDSEFLNCRKLVTLNKYRRLRMSRRRQRFDKIFELLFGFSLEKIL